MCAKAGAKSGLSTPPLPRTRELLACRLRSCSVGRERASLMNVCNFPSICRFLPLFYCSIILLSLASSAVSDLPTTASGSQTNHTHHCAFVFVHSTSHAGLLIVFSWYSHAILMAFRCSETILLQRTLALFLHFSCVIMIVFLFCSCTLLPIFL